MPSTTPQMQLRAMALGYDSGADLGEYGIVMRVKELRCLERIELPPFWRTTIDRIRFAISFA